MADSLKKNTLVYTNRDVLCIQDGKMRVLHSGSYGKIVRLRNDGAAAVLRIDGKIYLLPANMLVIADQMQPNSGGVHYG